MATIAIFDLDGTITRRDTYLPFLFMCARKLGLRPSLLLLPFHVFLYLAGAINNKGLKEVFLAKFLGGVDIGEIEAISERFVEQLLDRGTNSGARAALRVHLREGHRVILATASFDLYIGKVATRLGIREVVCTRTEVKDGKLTGRIMGDNCRGRVKLKLLEEILGERDWDNSVFYTDHYFDLPVLKRVRLGFLINPGIRTRLKLRNCNFEVLK